MAAVIDDATFSDEERNKENCKLCLKICIVGNKLKNNCDIVNATQNFALPVIYSENGKEFLDQGFKHSVIFVIEEFEGDIFDSLHKTGHPILGPTALVQLIQKGKPISIYSRPLYTTTMQGLVICFTGFHKREDLIRMATLIHHMGGSIRKDFSISKITHLIAHTVGGDKYRYAASFSIPIMQKDWIYELWALRYDKNCSATSEHMMKFKLPPFSGCKIAFFGFQDDEKEHMQEIALNNGGKVVSISDRSCTHLVMEDRLECIPDHPLEIRDIIHVVRSEWFWASIQMDASADEKMYLFEVTDLITTQSKMSDDDRKNNLRSAKRKRVETSSHELMFKGKSGITFEVSSRCSDDVQHQNSMSPRQQVCIELFQTETNYVEILQTIMSVFKEPLEQPEQVGGPLLVATEVKMIFGNLPPIYNVHRKLHEDLKKLIINWKEENCIGSCILNHSQDLVKAYPPFVNFFEKTKEVLRYCDMNKPRFHAFLKRCQSRPECGRQSLVELLIRPVQRLPSVMLLLNDILKKTSKRNPDYSITEKAILCLKEVMMHINEDKRKTEGQVAMFDIVNDIENCPPNILSSNRSLIIQAEVQELIDGFTHKSDVITIFLFTDMLEICKRKSKTTSMSKSPGIASLTSSLSRPQQKPFKHLELFHLSCIKRVINIKETEGLKDAFALVVRTSDELKEHLHIFILLSEEVGKDYFLRTLCQYIATTVCRVGGDSLLTCMEAQDLIIDTSETPTSPLSKAIKIASKTCDKLSRVLSIKKIQVKPITDCPVIPSDSSSKLCSSNTK